MAETLKKFGKYFLLDLVAQGGMAEIYRARMATPDGGARLVAIKRILANYSKNPEFVKMFKGEIKTTSSFTHPNIVQIYDYGEEENQLFLSMELVDGKNLRQFISRIADLKTSFPVEMILYIMEQAAAALAYAHQFKDRFTGKNLNIVHRDISPQNILISYDGAVKLIDFGIAKAVNEASAHIEETKAGVIKGKPSYLSPEQVEGETLDGRSDVFALGIVLWELLVGKRLFVSENDYAVLKLIENCTHYVKPPSMYNSKIPTELDALVLKCLQKNKDQRYLNAEEMQRAIHRFLYQFAPDFAPSDVAYYVKELFKNEIVEDRRLLQQLNAKAEELLKHVPPQAKPIRRVVSNLQDANSPAQTRTSTVSLVEETPSIDVPQTEEGTTLTPVFASPPPPSSNINPSRPRTTVVEYQPTNGKTDIKLELSAPVATHTAYVSTQSSKTRTGFTKESLKKNHEKTSSLGSFAKAAVFLVLLGGGYYYYSNFIQTPPSSSTALQQGSGVLVIEGNIKAATITLNDRPVGTALPLRLEGLTTDQALSLVVAANGYKKFVEPIFLKEGEVKNLHVELVREDSIGEAALGRQAGTVNTLGKTIPLRLEITPVVLGVSTRIYLNGLTVDPISAVGVAPLDTGLELVVEREGFRTFRKKFIISAQEAEKTSEWSLSIPLEPAKFGFLSIKTTPSADAYIQIDGIEEKIPTPILRKRIPVGTYQVKLLNSLLGMEKAVTITIQQDRFTSIEERLQVSDGDARVPGSN